jgi:hypothetical protein
MSALNLTSPTLPIARRVQAFFAPVDRATGTPTILDPSAPFDPEQPPSPWLAAGWIENFTRTAPTRVEQARAGAAGATALQYRSQLDARVEFEFRQWGKLQMAIAAGSDHMNVLAPAAGSVPRPAGGPPAPAVSLAPGSTSTQLQLTAPQFAPGDIVACDIDYSAQTGYLGTGIAAAYVRDPADIAGDADYIRRVTFNVARVAAVAGTALTLAQPLIGGAPQASAKIQKVMAFVDREGSAYFQEWSALFLMEESGGRVCFYYPRLQSCASAQEQRFPVATGIDGFALKASLIALPFTDGPMQILCYRSYFPAASAAVY